MGPEAGMDRLVRGVGDPLVAFFRAQRSMDPEAVGLPLEPTVKAVLTWLIEEVRADQHLGQRTPQEILDHCVTVLRQVRQYVLESLQEGAEGSERRNLTPSKDHRYDG